MADLSTYTHVFRADIRPANGQPGQQRVVKRARQPVSCTPCRSRKLKCDRGHPVCGTCSKRGDGDGCKYASGSSASATGSGGRAVGASSLSGTGTATSGPSPHGVATSGIRKGSAPRQEVALRLQKLEEMVNGLLHPVNGKIGKGSGRAKTTAQASESSITVASGPPSGVRLDLVFGDTGDSATGKESADKTTPSSTSSAPSGTGGHLSSEGAETTYAGATHWTAVLESIHDLQVYLEAEDEANLDPEPALEPEHEPEPEVTADSLVSFPSATAAAPSTTPSSSSSPPSGLRHTQPDILFGYIPPITTADIMAALPSRAETDTLLMAYFRDKFSETPIIHVPQFQRAYEAFWADPGSTSLLWISMMFSVLAGATVSLLRRSNAEATGLMNLASVPRRQGFVNMAIQCLVAGEYLKAKPYSVEALIMYAGSRIRERSGEDSFLWSVYGICARLAQRMGYHREATTLAMDASAFSVPTSSTGDSHTGTTAATKTSLAAAASGRRQKRVTPFEAEMRRRTWFAVETYDMFFSFQLGMPCVIHDDECDVQPPTNLRDEDFDVDSPVLPPPRPDTDDSSHMLYCRHKSRSVRLLRRVVRLVLTTAPADHAAVRALDADLRKLHAETPPPLRYVPPTRALFSDSAFEIIQRVALEMMHLKAVCVLHRRYLTERKGDAAFEPSRMAVRDAALRIMDVYAEVSVELYPGGKLHVIKSMLSSLTIHDFLMAAMILCLDLVESKGLTQHDRTIRLNALKLAYTQWNNRRALSPEAIHATRVLGAIIRKVSSVSPPSVSAAASTPAPPASAAGSPALARAAALAADHEARIQAARRGMAPACSPGSSFSSSGGGAGGVTGARQQPDSSGRLVGQPPSSASAHNIKNRDVNIDPALVTDTAAAPRVPRMQPPASAGMGFGLGVGSMMFVNSTVSESPGATPALHNSLSAVDGLGAGGGAGGHGSGRDGLGSGAILSNPIPGDAAVGESPSSASVTVAQDQLNPNIYKYFGRSIFQGGADTDASADARAGAGGQMDLGGDGGGPGPGPGHNSGGAGQQSTSDHVGMGMDIGMSMNMTDMGVYPAATSSDDAAAAATADALDSMDLMDVDMNWTLGDADMELMDLMVGTGTTTGTGEAGGEDDGPMAVDWNVIDSYLKGGGRAQDADPDPSTYNQRTTHIHH